MDMFLGILIGFVANSLSITIFNAIVAYKQKKLKQTKTK